MISNKIDLKQDKLTISFTRLGQRPFDAPDVLVIAAFFSSSTSVYNNKCIDLTSSQHVIQTPEKPGTCISVTVIIVPLEVRTANRSFERVIRHSLRVRLGPATSMILAELDA
jgi:hypothetical protein